MYHVQAKHFYNCLYSDEESVMDIDNAIRTQKIIDAAFKASNDGKLIVLS